jgi:putative two-component system response regulator
MINFVNESPALHATVLAEADSTRPRDAAQPPAGPIASAKIAIIDDEPINIKVARKYLQGVGYREFITTTESVTAMQLISREKPDVVLLDVMMPQVDGIQILQAIRADPALAHIPVLILTASTDSDTKRRALESGATDFLAKPVDPSDLIPRIRNALIVKAHHDHLSRYSEQLERQVRLRTVELEASRLQVIHCLARAAEYRDDTTGRHVIRVGRYTTLLARELGFADTDAEMLGLAAQLHDVGKIGLPDAILLKPGPLLPEEFTIVKRHCEIGHGIVQPLQDEDWHALKTCADSGLASAGENTILLTAARIALTHHEKWDGSGYPRGLSREAIPVEGRITAVADVFDALTSARSYKPAMPPELAVQTMEKGRSAHFDPNILDAMLRRLDDFLKVLAEQADPAGGGGGGEGVRG